jgi:hypothetical protein
MRPLLCTMLVLAACTTRDDASDASEAASARIATTGGTASPAQRRIAIHAGTWEGRTFRSDRDTGTRWTNVVNVLPDSSLTGSLRFAASPRSAAVAVTYLRVTDSTVVQELGPYYSPTVKAEVMTRVEARVRADSTWGTYEMVPTKGGPPERGRLAARRISKPPI